MLFSKITHIVILPGPLIAARIAVAGSYRDPVSAGFYKPIANSPHDWGCGGDELRNVIRGPRRSLRFSALELWSLQIVSRPIVPQ